MKELPTNSLFNTIAICYEIKGLQEITAKNSEKEYKKRDITLIDSSNEIITLTLWNNEAEISENDKIRSVVKNF